MIKYIKLRFPSLTIFYYFLINFQSINLLSGINVKPPPPTENNKLCEKNCNQSLPSPTFLPVTD